MGVDTKMLVYVREEPDPVVVRRLSVDLCEAFGPDRFWLFRKDNRHALSIEDRDSDDVCWHFDAPFEQPNGFPIAVHMATRYYGVNYERGDLSLIVGVAEWLDRRLPGCVILYGGDSSGMGCVIFNQIARSTLLDHLAAVGHRPYRGVFDHCMPETAKTTRPHCTFCDVDLMQYGWGKTYAAYVCEGCDWRQITRDGGDTWTEKDSIFGKDHA